MTLACTGSAAHRAGWLAVLLFGATALPVLADDHVPEPPSVALDARHAHAETFAYTRQADAYYFRAGLEELGILSLGLAQYFANKQANSTDWEFGYDWDSFRARLSGGGYSLDTNHFDTNFITHPGAGTLYYWAARSNRLSVTASFAYALVAATFWEFFGEMRERVSVNDMLVTPISGLVLGETTFQLGAFFDRSCATTPNTLLGTLFGPAKSAHDLLDGREPLRDSVCDEYGFTRRGAHEFRLSLGEAAVWRVQGPNVPAVAEIRLDLHTRVVAWDSYGSAGNGLRTFSDGHVTEIWLQSASGTTRWNDFTLGGSLVPIGMHYRKLDDTADAGRLVGYELLFGLFIATEYSAHRYDRSTTGTPDYFFSLDVPGMSLEYRRHTSSFCLELDLQVSPTLAAVSVFALEPYLTHGSRERLTAVTRAQGYNYAAGFTVRPRARLISKCVEVGVDLRGARLWGIDDVDRSPAQQSHLVENEARRSGRLWVSLGRLSWPLRLTTTFAVLERWGTLADARLARAEIALSESLDARF